MLNSHKFYVCKHCGNMAELIDDFGKLISNNLP